MVIDASAFVAILFGEPEWDAFSEAIIAQPIWLTSAVTFLESIMVISGRQGEPGVSAFQAFIDRANIAIAPFTAAQFTIAIDAFRRFGKGRYLAGLNFGDCFSDALAKATREPLLFKGDDFAQTDVERTL